MNEADNPNAYYTSYSGIQLKKLKSRLAFDYKQNKIDAQVAVQRCIVDAAVSDSFILSVY